MSYNTSKLFEDIRSLVLEHPCISLLEISRRLGIERHTIERAVLKNSRMTFRHYRSGCMTEKAILLLRNSNTSIKEVALTIGYQSPRAFSRAFAATMGVSPSIYRQGLQFGNGSNDDSEPVK